MPPFDTFEELISWVKTRREGGRSKQEIIDFLSRLRPILDEDTDDMVLSALDALTGYCGKQHRID